MKVTRLKQFGPDTPFSEAENEGELAKIMLLKYPKVCSKLSTDANYFSRVVNEIIEYRAWSVIGFDSFETFCREKLDKTIDEVNQILAGVKVLQSQGVTKMTVKQAMEAAPKMATHQEAGSMGGRGNKASSDTTSFIGRGSSYLAARIKRDHPEIAERAAAGEFKSVRQAAIAAEIVKVKTPLEQLRHWAKKATADELRQFLDEIGALLCQ